MSGGGRRPVELMSLQQVLKLDENLPRGHEETVRLFGRLDTANYYRVDETPELPAHHTSISSTTS